MDTIPRINGYVMITVGLLAMVGMAAIIGFGLIGKEPPGSLSTITATCVGSLIQWLIALTPQHQTRNESNEKKGSV